jgi:hypothetical protein
MLVHSFGHVGCDLPVRDSMGLRIATDHGGLVGRCDLRLPVGADVPGHHDIGRPGDADGAITLAGSRLRAPDGIP